GVLLTNKAVAPNKAATGVSHTIALLGDHYCNGSSALVCCAVPLATNCRCTSHTHAKQSAASANESDTPRRQARPHGGRFCAVIANPRRGNSLTLPRKPRCIY
ncbi:unnamed protein product, partial [Laminaria digitata]